MKTIGHYLYGDPIARGSFSTVSLGKDLQTNRDVAIKIIDVSKHPKINHYFDREIDIISSLNHRNVVKLLDQIREPPMIYLIFEYCPHGDLIKLTNGKHIKEHYVRKILTQVRDGLGYLHHKGIIHRDLKPQNILVNHEGVIKITDFGFAKYDHEDTMSQTICGTPYYMAPEIIKCARYNAKVDLWSFGIMMFQLLAGRLPFSARTHLDLLNKIERNAIVLPHRVRVSDDCEDLLYAVLQRDPDKRMDWEDFLTHRWFVESDLPTKSEIDQPRSQPIAIPSRSGTSQTPNSPPTALYYDGLTHFDPEYIMISPTSATPSLPSSLTSTLHFGDDP